jgi:hypothetical protein
VGDRKTIHKRLNGARQQYYRCDPESVARAAQHFKLDPNDARQRDELLSKLADVVFGTAKRGRPRGSKTAWGDERLNHLGDLYYAERYENQKLTDAAAARLISRDREFKHDDPDQIRQRLPLAREVHSEWAFEAWSIAAADYMAENPDELPQPDELDYP